MADPGWLRMGDPTWLTMGDPGWLSFPDPDGSIWGDRWHRRTVQTRARRWACGSGASRLSLGAQALKVTISTRTPRCPDGVPYWRWCGAC